MKNGSILLEKDISAARDGSITFKKEHLLHRQRTTRGKPTLFGQIHGRNRRTLLSFRSWDHSCKTISPVQGYLKIMAAYIRLAGAPIQQDKLLFLSTLKR